MRKLFLTLLTVATIGFVGCEADEVYDLDQKYTKLAEVVANNYDELTATIAQAVAEQAEINHSLQTAINEEAAAREAGDLQLQKELANTAIELRQELAKAVEGINNQMNANMDVVLDLLQQEADARTAGDVLLATSLAEEIASRLADDSEMKIAIMQNVNAIKANAADIIANKNAIAENTATLAKQLADNLAAQALLEAGDVDGLAELKTAEAALRYQIAKNMQGIKSNELEVVALAATTAEQFVNTMADVVENATAIAELDTEINYLGEDIEELTQETADLISSIDESLDTVSNTLTENIIVAITAVNSDVIELGDELDKVKDDVDNTIANSISTVQDQVNDLSDSVNTLEESVGNPITFNGYVTKIGETVTVAGVAEQGDHVRIFYDGAYRIEFENVESGMSDTYNDLTAKTQEHAADVRIDASVVIDENDNGGTLQLFVEGKAIEGLQTQVANVEEDVNALQDAALAELSRTVTISIENFHDTGIARTFSKEVSGEKEYVSFDVPFDHYFYWHKTAGQLQESDGIKAGSPYYLGSAVVRLQFYVGQVTDGDDDGTQITQADAVNIEKTFKETLWLTRQNVQIKGVYYNVDTKKIIGGTHNFKAHPTKQANLYAHIPHSGKQLVVQFDFDKDGVVDKSKKWIGGGSYPAKIDAARNWIKDKIKEEFDLTNEEAAYYSNSNSTQADGFWIRMNRINKTLDGLNILQGDTKKSITSKHLRIYTDPFDNSEYVQVNLNNGNWKTITRPQNDEAEGLIDKVYLKGNDVILEDFSIETEETFGSIHEGGESYTFKIKVSGTAGDNFVKTVLTNLGKSGDGTGNGRYDIKGTRMEAKAYSSDKKQFIGDICDYDADELDPHFFVTSEHKTNVKLHATYRGDIMIYKIPRNTLNVANVGAGPFDYKVYNWDQDSSAWDKGESGTDDDYVLIGVAEIKSHALTNYAWSTAKTGIKNKFDLDHLIVLQGSQAGALDVEDKDVNITMQVWDTGCSNKTDSVTRNLRTAANQGGSITNRKLIL